MQTKFIAIACGVSLALVLPSVSHGAPAGSSQTHPTSNAVLPDDDVNQKMQARADKSTLDNIRRMATASPGHRIPIPIQTSVSMWSYPDSPQRHQKSVPSGLTSTVAAFTDSLKVAGSESKLQRTPFASASAISSIWTDRAFPKLRLDFQGGFNKTFTNNTSNRTTTRTVGVGNFQLQTNKPAFSYSETVSAVLVTDDAIDLTANSNTKKRALRNLLRKAFTLSFTDDTISVVDAAVRPPTNGIAVYRAAGISRELTALDVAAGLTCNILPAGSLFNLGDVFSTCECLDEVCDKRTFSLELTKTHLQVRDNNTNTITWTSKQFAKDAAQVWFNEGDGSLQVLASNREVLWRTSAIRGITNPSALLTHINIYGKLSIAVDGENLWQAPGVGAGDPHCGVVTPSTYLSPGIIAKSCDDRYEMWFDHTHSTTNTPTPGSIYIIDTRNSTVRTIASFNATHRTYVIFRGDGNFVVYEDPNQSADGSGFVPKWDVHHYASGSVDADSLELKLYQDGTLKGSYLRPGSTTPVHYFSL